MLHRGGCVCTHQSSIRLIKRPGALEAEAKVSNLWLSQGSWVEELFTQEQQGCSARSWDIQLCAHSLPGGVGFQLKEEGGREAGQAPPPSSPHWGARGMQDGGGFPPCWVSVAELGVLGLVLVMLGFPWDNSGFVLAWTRVPHPSQRFSGASCPSSQRIFPPPMWKSISHCHHTAPSALPGVLLALPNFQALPGLSILPLHVVFGICISFLFISL